jgi:acetoin utilization protein AcuB
MDDKIENFMTRAVHTLAATRSLADAHALMRAHRIRHLPVLDAGKLVGIVTERDLALVETFRLVDPGKVTVQDAMSPDVFTVAPGTPVAEVAHRMAQDRLGSAVVQQGSKVVGIFTVVDALRALDFLLSSPGVKVALHQALVPPSSAAAS